MKDFDLLDQEEREKEYTKYINKKIPKTKNFPTLIYAYLVGGIICMIGQGIYDLILYWYPTMPREEATAWMLGVLIFLASFLTGIGWYDKIASFAGAGSIVPITGFSNSISSPAMEFKKEGIIYGLCVKMFSVAGPVIVVGTVVSVLIGLIYFLFAL